MCRNSIEPHSRRQTLASLGRRASGPEVAQQGAHHAATLMSSGGRSGNRPNERLRLGDRKRRWGNGRQRVGRARYGE